VNDLYKSIDDKTFFLN